MADAEEELLKAIDVVFQCPDAKDIEEDGKENKPNGKLALSKHQGISKLAQTVQDVIREACQKGFTADGPIGGHLKRPQTNVGGEPQPERGTVYDEKTLADEITTHDGRF